MLVTEWFGLTHANYLVVPRLVLESMSEEWQHRFTALMGEVGETFDPDGWHPRFTERYEVRIRDELGRFRYDSMADYRRGSCEEFRLK